MRTFDEIKSLVLHFAQADDRVRAVLLNGSRVNTKINPDSFQDYDLTFLVTDLSSFISDHDWTNYFGKKTIWQLPKEMSFGADHDDPCFTYLMIFEDGNRLDITLAPIDYFKTTEYKLDSLSVLCLDKDNLLQTLPTASDKDYWIKKPSQKEFGDVCNEFWWVSIYVAKGLKRKEIYYAKEMMDTVVRPMLLKLITWKIGVENNFSVSIGTKGKFLPLFISEELNDRILSTYTDASLDNNWKSLFTAFDLFKQIAFEVATLLNYDYNIIEIENTIDHIQKNYQI